MPGVSLHAVDVAAGRPAEGMAVALHRLGPERREVAAGQLGPGGALDHPVTRARLEPGLYEAVFQVGSYLGRGDAFLDDVPVRFRITDPEQHYHLPFKFTAWGYSVFRGS